MADDAASRGDRPGELHRFCWPLWQRSLLRLFMTFVLIVGVVGCAKGLVAGSRSGLAGLGVALIVVFVALWLYAELRVVRGNVVVSEDGVHVRNHLRSYDVGWAEIEDCEATGNHHALRLDDGRRIRLWGLAEGPFGATKLGARQAELLTQEIARRRDARVGGASGSAPEMSPTSG